MGFLEGRFLSSGVFHEGHLSRNHLLGAFSVRGSEVGADSQGRLYSFRGDDMSLVNSIQKE